jgi:hypothetical protein
MSAWSESVSCFNSKYERTTFKTSDIYPDVSLSGDSTKHVGMTALLEQRRRCSNLGARRPPLPIRPTHLAKLQLHSLPVWPSVVPGRVTAGNGVADGFDGEKGKVWWPVPALDVCVGSSGYEAAGGAFKVHAYAFGVAAHWGRATMWRRAGRGMCQDRANRRRRGPGRQSFDARRKSDAPPACSGDLRGRRQRPVGFQRRHRS